MINYEKLPHYLNTHCYNIEKLEFPKGGIFDGFVDATYIITMEGSQRSKDLYKKLKEFNPTKTVYISHNKGFKKCNKILYDKKVYFDVINSYFNVFYDSYKKKYNNILLLEDDYEFDLELVNQDTINHIHTFFKKRIGQSFFYNIGAIPPLFIPILIDNHHYMGIQTLPNHSVIYTRKIQDDIVMNIIKPVEKVKFFDSWISKKYTGYFYKYPFCYQTFPATDQSSEWKLPLWDNCVTPIVKMIGLDQNSKPGFQRAYMISMVINYFLFIIFTIVLLLVIFNIVYIFAMKKSFL
jgi:hypothetical protein